MFGKERWKKIKFPQGFNTSANYQISNYGRVRNILKDGSYQIKKPIFYQNQLIYKFSFPAKLNDGVRPILHQKASHMVGKYFSKDFFPGCYVVWKDYNRLNNYVSNLLCLDEHEGRSHVAKGRYKKAEQFLVTPPEEIRESNSDNGTSPHKVETDDSYFKAMPEFPNYEINRFGVIRRRKPPFKGKVMKQRLHPDKFYFLDLRDKKNNRRTVYPHKEVARHWCINVKPDERTIVIHRDGNTLNNCSDNLEWVDHSEALKYQFEQGYRDNRKSWKTRKKLYGNGFKKQKSNQKNASAK